MSPGTRYNILLVTQKRSGEGKEGAGQDDGWRYRGRSDAERQREKYGETSWQRAQKEWVQRESVREMDDNWWEGKEEKYENYCTGGDQGRRER